MASQQQSSLILQGEPDHLFTQANYPKPFAFDENVAHVFDDMISRSVPLYEEVNHKILRWCRYFYQQNTHIVDLGCSTATTLAFLSQNLPFETVSFIGIDSSQPMIDKARTKLNQISNNHQVQLYCDDLFNRDFSHASIVILNYTLQFLPVNKRLKLLEKIFQSLVNGGILIMSEKLRCASPEIEDISRNIYEDFKLARGYSKTEVERKKEALEQVLISHTATEHLAMLKKAGFTDTEPVLRLDSFCTFLAIKKEIQ